MPIGGTEPSAITDSERLARLRLARSENVGPITWHQLLAHYGNATDALEALPELARRGGRRKPPRLAPPEAAEAELEAAADLGAGLLACGEPGYPLALAALEDAPPVILLKGDAGLLERPAVAIVGARNASANGLRLAERLARDLGEAGLVVVSGLARGIDTAAHKGSLESGTVAVLAGGLDVVYPPENRGLQAAVAERGLLVSERPPGAVPQARHFPRRNRIVSGLALGALVVEAALRSGSLITARLAGEQGREVFAVPGSPLDPRARGCNRLLREGAHLVESAEDVLGVLEGQLRDGAVRYRAPSGLSDLRSAEASESQEEAEESPTRAVLGLLGADPVPVDELVRRCHVSPASVSRSLLELELAGRIERHPGGRIALKVLQEEPAEAYEPS